MKESLVNLSGSIWGTYVLNWRVVRSPPLLLAKNKAAHLNFTKKKKAKQKNLLDKPEAFENPSSEQTSQI